MLAKVKGGDEVFLEENAMPIAVLHTPAPIGRPLAECIAMLPKRSGIVIDEDFASDPAEVIELHRESLDRQPGTERIVHLRHFPMIPGLEVLLLS